jgi:hypothetical protein
MANVHAGYVEWLIHRYHPAKIAFALLFGIAAFGQAASAQMSGPMKATAPEKMMPPEKAQKMRECDKRAKQQKIKMEDHARFVNKCMAESK